MLYLQTENAECGLVCLAYASAKLGAHPDIGELRRRFLVSNRGVDLKQVVEMAAAMDMVSRAVRCELEELRQLKLPAILHWNLKHFVVLDKVTSRHVIVHDPAVGRVKFTHAEAGRRFTGVALELSQAPAFRPRNPPPTISIWSWIRFTPNLSNGLGQTLVLSLMLQAYVLASPFFMQLAIDQAALKGDGELMAVLALGFGLFGLFNVGAGLLRSLAIQQLSAFLSWDMSIRLFRHLVRLPLEWFQKRKLADTISRFDAINPIRDLVSGALISAVIDGLLAVTTVLMMFLFSWQLACIALFGVVCLIGVKLAALPRSLRLGAENLAASIAENGKRIETIKAIQTIKTMAAESQQEVQWSNKYADLIRKKIAAGSFQFSIDTARQTIDVLASVAIIYIGVMAIIGGNLTIGVLYAFVSYKGQFATAVNNVVDQMIQWRLSDIYSMRLADIVLSPKEEGVDHIDYALPPMGGNIDVLNLGFRYGPLEPFVLKSVNLSVKAGEFLAIVGPSGAGKSTLLKVMCGLYPATFGEVRLDGRPLSSWGLKTMRSMYGVVMQDDELLSGTIADNVSFFDNKVNMDEIWRALDAAALKDEVMAMPMKAESFVGDMGGALSGGQKQRLLIARALYKKPKILFFDEATSHLDAANEEKINRSLRSLEVTRIVIAHRRETIAAADAVFDIRTGKILRRPGQRDEALTGSSPPQVETAIGDVAAE
jgi:ATP-binding cassette subfamily B protein RaxB